MGDRNMIRKICALIIMSMLLSVSIVVIVNNDTDVRATSGGSGDGDSGSIGLDYDYMWFNITENLSNVVHDDSIWGKGDEVIRMGRAFGTPGDEWTANYLYYELKDNLSLEDVTKIKLETS
jgi:hypothetical protein